MAVAEPQELAFGSMNSGGEYEAQMKSDLRKVLSEAHKPMRWSGPGLVEGSGLVLKGMCLQLTRALFRRGAKRSA
jgi:hypothetical protein